VVATWAAVPLGDGDGVQVGGHEGGVGGSRELRRLVDLGGARGDLLLGDLAGERPQLLVLLAEATHR
jgi:hypothetical protein